MDLLLDKLEALRETRSKFANNSELAKALQSDHQLASEVRFLAKEILNRTLKGCSNCMTDAYIQLVTTKKEIAMEKDKRQFKLRNGALLHDAENNDVSKIMTVSNCTDALALHHLRTNYEHAIKYFETVPDNLDELLREMPTNALNNLEDDNTAHAGKSSLHVKLYDEVSEMISQKKSNKDIEATIKDVDRSLLREIIKEARSKKIM